MPTAREIITDALFEIGVLQAQGEAPSAADAQLALRRLQSLLDAWRAQQLTLSVQDRETYTIPSGSSTFTIGTGGDLAVQRPTWVASMNYINPGSSPPNEVPMGPMDRDAYAAQSQKTLVSGLPQQYFYQPSPLPLGTMFIWPTPNQDVTLALYLLQGIDAPTTLNSIVQGPNGYQEAFLYQLAIRLCRPFGLAIPADTMMMARDSWNRMIAQNVQPGVMGVDAALTPNFGSAFNILTGNYTGSSNR